jgi:radical SAM superfamily enzyme YgiQ (UPF0313 family)
MKKDVVILFFPKTSGNGSGKRLPYTLLYLERTLRGLGLEVILVDESCQPNYPAALDQKRDRILLAGVSSMTGSQISGGIAFSKWLRKAGSAPIVWGGWHPTLLPKQTLQEPYVDFVVIGQGERPLRQLVERLLNGQDPSDIPGLGFKRGTEIFVNRSAPFDGINAFPPINLGLLDPNNYVYSAAPLGKRCMVYFASHGCPFNCGFCSMAAVYRHHWYHKPVSQIIEDLRTLKERAGIDSMYFMDPNLFVNPDFCRQLARAMIDAELNLRWYSQGHTRLLTTRFTDEDMRLFVQSGCSQIIVGAESGDPEVLDVVGKRAKVEDTFRLVALLKRHGIVPYLSTMVCLPMNPARDLDLTIDMLARAKLMDPRLQASIWNYTPYPGTELYERAKQKGFIPPQRLEDWAVHSLTSFRAPWAPRGYAKRLELFQECYFRMLDPQAHGKFRHPAVRVLAFPINMVLFAITWLRFKTKYYGFPIEAVVFRRLFQLYDQKRHNGTL